MPTPGQVLGDIEIVSTDPAAGAELSYTADADMIVHSLYFTFSTDANVGNRSVTVVADDGTNIFFRSATSFVQTASTPSVTYGAFEGAPVVTVGNILIALPATGLRLSKGDRVRTLTAAKQAGDDFSAMTLQIERLGAV